MEIIYTFRSNKHLGKIKCHDEQVEFLNKTLFNIFSNFISSKVKTIRPCPSPWIIQTVKSLLRKKNRAYKSFLRSCKSNNKIEGIQKMKAEGPKLIDNAKQNNFFKVGNTLANQRTSDRTYWSVINTVLKVPKLQPPSVPLKQT